MGNQMTWLLCMLGVKEGGEGGGCRSEKRAVGELSACSLESAVGEGEKRTYQ